MNARIAISLVHVVLLCALGTSSWGQRAQAQQLVLLDQVVNPKRGAAGLNKSEYSVYAKDFANPSPASLRAPVNFADGRIHVRLEVLSKPSSVDTLFTLCIHNDAEQTCIRYLPKYTAPGIYEYDQPMLGQYNYDVYDFGRPVTRVILALKDGMERLLDPSDPAFDSFFPTEYRITMAIVAKGASYVTPEPQPPRDAGVPDAGSPTPDAAVTPARDAGTSSGAGTGTALVLVDHRLTASTQSAADAKVVFPLSAQAPTNLRTPIDYGAGKLHARVEVFSKPSGAPTLLKACLESMSGKTLCSDDLGGQSYLSLGSIDHEQSFSSMPNAASYDFAGPVRRAYLRVSDAFGASAAGKSEFFPTDLKLVLTLLPPGAAYRPPWEQTHARDGGAATGAPRADRPGTSTPDDEAEPSDPASDGGPRAARDAGGAPAQEGASAGPDGVFEPGDDGCALGTRRHGSAWTNGMWALLVLGSCVRRVRIRTRARAQTSTAR